MIKNNELNLSIYVHVPFCASTCDFCSFYQKKANKNEIQNYLKGIEQESANMLNNYFIDTMFWGGGTPGLLMASDLYSLGKSILNKIYNVPKEWTVEMAPSTVKPEKLKVLKDLGVTRISMGVQTFNDHKLLQLGRLHSKKQIYKAWDYILKAGFKSTNLDLMFALPGQSIKDLNEDLNELISLNPSHISAYCLTFEENTKLFLKLSSGIIKRNINEEIKMYKFIWNFFKKNNYIQYEISNFSKENHQCLHNLNTWRMNEWIGLGPSASSQYKNKRFTNIISIKDWLFGLNNKKKIYFEEEYINDDILALDSIIFGMRMNEGINLKILKNRFPKFNWLVINEIILNLIKWKYCDFIQDQEIFKLNTNGMLIIDSISCYIMEKI